MKVKFNVKDKSALSFLKENLLECLIDGNKHRIDDDQSPYYLMKDEMYFKIDCKIKIGEHFKIEIFDRSQLSGKELVNQYTYRCEKYDDVALKMVLLDFNIQAK